MMHIQVDGHIDDQHRLHAEVPGPFPTGPVTVFVSPKVADDDPTDAWMHGNAHEWADELSDTRQDIYTSEDGEPVDRT